MVIVERILTYMPLTEDSRMVPVSVRPCGIAFAAAQIEIPASEVA